MLKKLEERRVALVREMKRQGIKFMTKEQLREVKPGSAPYKTKTSTRSDPRPLVLSKCADAKKLCLEWYFSIYQKYKRAVSRYLAGDLAVEFPPGTYRPPPHQAAPR